MKVKKNWKSVRINSGIFGFQIQKDTKWNSGLNDSEIEKYEKDLGFKFPKIFKLFLKTMNGTDKPAVNVYGETGEPYKYSPAYYSYPRDLKNIKKMIEWICESFKMSLHDIDGDKIPFIIPIVSHRFLIVDRAGKNPILSMYGHDIVPYASSLRAFLINDIFNEHLQEDNLEDIPVNFWLK